MNDPHAFIFFGSSGSGKGTQAELLIDYLQKKGRKTIYLETGGKIREFMTDKTYTATLTKNVINHGGLLPAFLPIWLWTTHLHKNFTGQEDLVLDGLCRRVSEAPVLDAAMKFYKIGKCFVIMLNVSDEWAATRLKSRGRKDDTDEYIKSRIAWYKRDVAPAIDFFKSHKDYAFLDINGEGSVEEVHKEIINKIENTIFLAPSSLKPSAY